MEKILSWLENGIRKLEDCFETFAKKAKRLDDHINTKLPKIKPESAARFDKALLKSIDKEIKNGFRFIA